MPPITTNQGVLLERLEALRCDIAELRVVVDAQSKDYRDFREAYVKAHARVEGQAEAAHRRLDEHELDHVQLEGDVRQLKEQLAPVVMWGKVVAFVGSAVMLSVIALIWSLITGQVHMVFP